MTNRCYENQSQSIYRSEKNNNDDKTNNNYNNKNSNINNSSSNDKNTIIF